MASKVLHSRAAKAVTGCNMGTRMSRTPGGGSSTKQCVFGKEGERGMGDKYSGNNFKSPVWDNPTKTKSRMGTNKGWKTMPNRYESVSHNPSGASNTALRNEDRTMADDT